MTLGAIYMQGVATAFKSGTPQASSLVKYMLVPPQRTSTSLGRAEWSFVLRQTSTMQLWLLREIMLIVRCEEYPQTKSIGCFHFSSMDFLVWTFFKVSIKFPTNSFQFIYNSNAMTSVFWGKFSFYTNFPTRLILVLEAESFNREGQRVTRCPGRISTN